MSFLIKLQASSLQLYLKRGSGTDVFRWILQNFYEYLFYRTSLDDYFCVLLKTRSTFIFKHIGRRINASWILSLDQRLMNLQFRSCIHWKTSSWHDIWLSLPSRHYLAQNQQLKLQKRVWNMFKAKDTTTMSLMSFWCLYWVTVDLEQVNGGWVGSALLIWFQY